MYNRSLTLTLSTLESCFLWGPRQVGKSHFLREKYPGARSYDLLSASVFRRFKINPGLLREECEARALSGGTQVQPIIIDEVQKVPELLDEVHWLIENKNLRFILCGSSARKLRHGQANLLGGRAVRYEMFPLTTREIPDFSLEKALNSGLLPKLYGSSHANRLKQAYVDDYLKEEVVAESLVRNLDYFHRFVEVIGVMNGEIVKYEKIASDVGASGKTIKEYFQILVDTLLGFYLPAFTTRRTKRRETLAPKFFLFDVGIAGYLAKWGRLESGSLAFGRAFELFLMQEVRAHRSYSEQFYAIHYWRLSDEYEVDLVLNNGEVIIEFKSVTLVNERHLRGIRALKKIHLAKYYIVVSRDPAPRQTADGVNIWPWQYFLDQLWSNAILRH